MSAWALARDGDGAIVARGAYVHGYVLYLKGGKPRFAIRVSNTLHEVAADRRVVGEWTHLVGVLTQDKELRLYVNGELAGTASGGAFLTSDPGELMEIGADDSNNVGNYESPFPFTGLIDEVRVFHRALSAAEIAQLAAEPGGGPVSPALALRYSFDGGDARDRSGNGNHGTVEGAEPTDAGVAGGAMRFNGKLRDPNQPRPGKYLWSQRVPLVARALVLVDPSVAAPGAGTVGGRTTGKTLFVAGTGRYQALAESAEDATPTVREDVLAPFAELEKGGAGTLWALSPNDGTKLAEYRLGALPVFDGMIAAAGRLYIATTAGKVLCLEGKQE